jgi:hypothetical protein
LRGCFTKLPRRFPGLGLQLLVDDFPIAATTLKRTNHRPTYYEKNPALTGGIIFSDGVWYDFRVSSGTAGYEIAEKVASGTGEREGKIPTTITVVRQAPGSTKETL